MKEQRKSHEVDQAAQGALADSQSQAIQDQLLQRETSPLHTLTVGNLQSQLWLSLEFRSCVGHPTLHAHHTCIISSAKHDNDNCTYSNTPMDTLTDNH